MFTGIVTSLGTIVERHPHRILIDTPGIDEALGASIAVDGCCLTVVETERAPADLPPAPDEAPLPTQRVRFDVLPETLGKTRLGTLDVGDQVNLEAALRAGDPLGGHIVQGHVDGTGTVRSSETDPEGRWLDLWIDPPADILRLCIERGSITVNGTSLTVMQLDEQGIRLQLIPETQRRTNLASLRPGALVNLEADVIARYVERLLAPTR